MSDAEEQTASEAPAQKPARRARVRKSDIIIFGVILAVIALFASIAYDRITVRQDIAAATPIANRVIDLVAKRDGASIRSMGNDTFKKTYTVVALNKQLDAIELVTSEKPTIDQSARSKGSAGRSVVVVYKYPKKLADQPFYLAVEVVRRNDSSDWKLTRLSGSADPNRL